MLKELSITLHGDETKLSFSEWDEVPNYLATTISDFTGGAYVITNILPILSKEDWEEFKRAGDMAFTLMSGK